MKLYTPALTWAVLILPAAPAFAQQPPLEIKERTITVLGAGTVKYRPEGAKITFGVRAVDNIFGTAWKDNQVQAEKLKTALEGLKIDGLQVKISVPDVIHNENLANGVQAPMVGGVPGGFNDKAFSVVRSFQVVVTEKDFAQLHKQVLKVIETAMTHGANSPSAVGMNNAMLMGGGFPQGNSITRVEFQSSDDRAHRAKAYQKAVEAALSNAYGAAKGAKVNQGDIYSITEHQQQPEVNYNFGLLQNETPQQDVSGEVDLTVRVRVTVKF